jgi:lipopolysaccharide export system permease protein
MLSGQRKILAMLFESSIRRELARSFNAALVVLLTVVMTMMLVRALNQASRGEVDPQAILLFLTYAVITQLAPVLTVALCLAVASVLSRMYRDSEMAIWHTSGVGLTRFLPPVLRFAWPIWLAIAALMTLVAPWANQARDEMRARYEQRSDLERVAPGQFQESSGGRYVFFIDRDSRADGTAHQVFVAGTEADGSISVISARSARLQPRDGSTFLLLEQGQRMVRSADTGSSHPTVLAEFERYWVQVRNRSPGAIDSAKRSGLPLWTLWQSHTAPDLAEIAWRVGIPLAAINLTVLALAVTAANPRAGRSGNLLVMLLAFVVYHNLLSVGKDWIARGRWDAWAFILVLHVGVGLAALLWLLQRDWPRWWRWRTAEGAA